MSADFLRSRIISTPLGNMSAVSSQLGLHSLVFSESPLFSRFPDTMAFSSSSDPSSAILDYMEYELQLYFSRALQSFQTPLAPKGSVFALSVWEALRNMPYSTTKSYQYIAQAIGR